MASASLINKSIIGRARDEVYVAAVPLIATKGPAQLLLSAAYSLNLWDLQHFMVILKTSSPPPSSQVFIFDFQPQDPEDISVALAVLSGKAVPGAVRLRKLKKLPRRRCWFIGFSDVNTVTRACKFNENWDRNLRVGAHDCRDYTNGLVKQLTGEEQVLDRLRMQQR